MTILTSELLSLPPVTRILIKNNGETQPRRLCNIVALKESNGLLYEYKILFPGHNGFEMIKNAIFSSVKGIIKQGFASWKSTNVEVCYHSNGWLTYKNIEHNSKSHVPHRWRVTPFRKIKKVAHFLRLSYKGADQLNIYNKNPEFVLELPWDVNIPFSVDFYLTRELIKFQIPDKFGDSQQFFLEDLENNFFLTLHCYKSENYDGNFIIFPSRPFWIVLRDYLYEIFYDFKQLHRR